MLSDEEKERAGVINAQYWCRVPVKILYNSHAALLREVKRLEREVIEWMEDSIYSNGFTETDGDRKGWTETMAKGSVMNTCEELVRMGKWEKHPNGVGRRWWYRRIEP